MAWEFVTELTFTGENQFTPTVLPNPDSIASDIMNGSSKDYYNDLPSVAVSLGTWWVGYPATHTSYQLTNGFIHVGYNSYDEIRIEDINGNFITWVTFFNWYRKFHIAVLINHELQEAIVCSIRSNRDTSDKSVVNYYNISSHSTAPLTVTMRRQIYEVINGSLPVTAPNLFIGDSTGVARQIENAYIGVNGVAKKVNGIYIGDANGVARKI